MEQAKLKAEASKIEAVSSSFSKSNFISDFKNINYNTHFFCQITFRTTCLSFIMLTFTIDHKLSSSFGTTERLV